MHARTLFPCTAQIRGPKPYPRFMSSRYSHRDLVGNQVLDRDKLALCELEH